MDGDGGVLLGSGFSFRGTRPGNGDSFLRRVHRVGEMVRWYAGTLVPFLQTTTTWWAAIGVVEQGPPEEGKGGIIRLLSRRFGACLFWFALGGGWT